MPFYFGNIYLYFMFIVEKEELFNIFQWFCLHVTSRISIKQHSNHQLIEQAWVDFYICVQLCQQVRYSDESINESLVNHPIHLFQPIWNLAEPCSTLKWRWQIYSIQVSVVWWIADAYRQSATPLRQFHRGAGKHFKVGMRIYPVKIHPQR
jgi:hypothetical protein